MQTNLFNYNFSRWFTEGLSWRLIVPCLQTNVPTMINSEVHSQVLVRYLYLYNFSQTFTRPLCITRRNPPRKKAVVSAHLRTSRAGAHREREGVDNNTWIRGKQTSKGRGGDPKMQMNSTTGLFCMRLSFVLSHFRLHFQNVNIQRHV